ncbi:hypothetical protein NDU88_002981 [Pleurodeles waltl]|uniref:Uncharacterized protein n=1 Tax=Pleurodeles waltl TaxID=8319 RepID=A0AAV7W0U9_PLEWA|nr:hypothetical protein NDU88_002981 [Pleurodeles waltl]
MGEGGTWLRVEEQGLDRPLRAGGAVLRSNGAVEVVGAGPARPRFFSPERKRGGPPTPRALLTPTSAEIQQQIENGRWGIPTRHWRGHQALCKDNRGPVDDEFAESEAEWGLALCLAPILGKSPIRAWRASTKGQCEHVLYEPLGRRAVERCVWGPGRERSRCSSAGLPGDGEETLQRRTEEGQHRLRGPLDRGRGCIAQSGGAADTVGTCGLGERRAAHRPGVEAESCPGGPCERRWACQTQTFLWRRRAETPHTSQILLDPSSTQVRGTGHPGGALYKADFTARPRFRYKLRTAGGAHRQAIGEDIRLYARLGGPRRRRVHRVRSKVGPKATPGINSWKGACTLGQCKPGNTLYMNNWGNQRRIYQAPPC